MRILLIPPYLVPPDMRSPCRDERLEVLGDDSRYGPFLRVSLRGECKNVRAEPGLDAEILDCAAEGVLLRNLGGQAEHGDRIWRKVKTPAGLEGRASGSHMEQERHEAACSCCSGLLSARCLFRRRAGRRGARRRRAERTTRSSRRPNPEAASSGRRHDPETGEQWPIRLPYEVLNTVYVLDLIALQIGPFLPVVDVEDCRRSHRPSSSSEELVCAAE